MQSPKKKIPIILAGSIIKEIKSVREHELFRGRVGVVGVVGGGGRWLLGWAKDGDEEGQAVAPKRMYPTPYPGKNYLLLRLSSWQPPCVIEQFPTLSPFTFFPLSRPIFQFD